MGGSYFENSHREAPSSFLLLSATNLDVRPGRANRERACGFRTWASPGPCTGREPSQFDLQTVNHPPILTETFFERYVKASGEMQAADKTPWFVPSEMLRGLKSSPSS